MSRPIFLIYLVAFYLVAEGSSLIFGQQLRCDITCPYVYVPVCGSDGQSYPNMCFLYAASCWNNNLTFVRPGPCVNPDPCNIPCNRLLFPICGSDGVTYQNPCLLMLADCIYVGGRIKKVHNGKCNTTFQGTPIPRPIPAPLTPPTTTTTTTTTPPPSRKRCPFGCTREYIPVCGSDGITYPNECSFNAVACKDPYLTIVSEGVCANRPILPPTMPRCPLGCNKVYKPVCGSDGATYVNICLLAMAMCDDPTITKTKDGPCHPLAFTTGSSSTKRPIILERPGGVTMAPNREFCRKDCPFSYEPICGTDGVTYTNKCTFDVAVCVNASLKADYNGNCI